MHLNLPENLRIAVLQPPTTTNAAITSDYVSLKNAHRAWILFIFKQAVAHATVASIYEATVVAGSDGQAMTATQRIWCNEDISDDLNLLRAAADAASETLTADAADKLVIIEVDPAKLTAGYDCIAGHTTASSEATDFVTILALIEDRYPQALPPSSIID